jgi:hypothetical protein
MPLAREPTPTPRHHGVVPDLCWPSPAGVQDWSQGRISSPLAAYVASLVATHCVDRPRRPRYVRSIAPVGSRIHFWVSL